MTAKTDQVEGIEISECRVGARRDIRLLTVMGYIDTMTCSTLLRKITDEINHGAYHIIVDMAQVNYVSSAGWGVFVGEIKGIREKGGDLKIVQMTPEVYDVFEMLEFNKILSYYDSIEEAISDFDLSIGLDITKSVRKSYNSNTAMDIAVANPIKTKRTNQGGGAGDAHSTYHFKKPQIDEKLIPVSEKIKLIVLDDPNSGALKIKKQLDTPRFGNVKINVFKVYTILRDLNLDNKEKRFRFYRSR